MRSNNDTCRPFVLKTRELGPVARGHPGQHSRSEREQMLQRILSETCCHSFFSFL
ncbi:MAG: hypothetical protein ACXW2E_11155 [Nitrososphaeraceae archaeon]